MFKPEEKLKIINDYKIHETDTGSVEVQIALLTADIKRLLEHFKIHKKDLHSKRGLLKMVAKRRKLLKVLAKEDEKKHDALVKKLGL
ncbi:MAG: 30S ribosomal protein S15 [Candidatus Paceibacterota bacterium]|jgi:small subunit ribosomal protein S15|nr:30S ribosomal protein S15 [Candidatus Paceibacterota bacterium]MDD4830949.1 30S ribosomal protein S15 [Candidatus Paceibacterota bacterium]MDD4874889.1 30S ribosomal protein S15 [Candidatus Paceibacterota bacterium]